MGGSSTTCGLSGRLSLIKCTLRINQYCQREPEGDVLPPTTVLHTIIVEYNTPQLAGDNDRSISRLRTAYAGQAVPSAYRRVRIIRCLFLGRMSSSKVIDQVEYEQVVQWLDDNPTYWKGTKILPDHCGCVGAVVKASGLSLLLCLAAGGFLGALLFSRRRAQQRDAEVFSDAGGMLRLNIDEINPQTDPAKLVGPGNRM